MVVNRQRRISVPLKPLEEFARRAHGALRFSEGAVTICLVSDIAIARLNRRYRGKIGPTDVLSFPSGARNGGQASRPSSRADGGAADYIGDIAISPAAARRNARLYSRSLPDELRVLILHGMIHLAGYDHETDHGEMDRLERRMRKTLGLS